MTAPHTDRASRPDDMTRPGAAVVFLAIGVVARGMAITSASVLIPFIRDDFDVTEGMADLALSLLLVVGGATVVTSGRLGDRIGRTRLFTISGLTMGGGFLIAGFAPGIGVLLFGQAVAGLGFGAMNTCSFGIMNTLFPAAPADNDATRRRQRAFGAHAIGLGTGNGLGPALGVLFSHTLTWRLTFLVIAPVAVVSVIGVKRTVAAVHGTPTRMPLDLGGSAILVLGLAALLFAFGRASSDGWVFARDGSGPSTSFVLLLVAITLLVVFVLYEIREQRHARGPLLDRSILSVRTFLLGLGAMTALFGVGIAYTSVFPLFFQLVDAGDSVALAVAVLSLGAGIAVGGAVSTPVVRRLGRDVTVVVAFVVLLVGLAGVVPTIFPGADPWLYAPALSVFGTGFGVGFATIAPLALGDVPREKSASASGLLASSRQVAAGLITAVLASLFLSVALSGTRTALDNVPGLTESERDDIVAVLDNESHTTHEHSVSVAAGGDAKELIRDKLPAGKADAAIEAADAETAGAARIMTYTAMGLSVFGFAAAFALRKHERRARRGAAQ